MTAYAFEDTRYWSARKVGEKPGAFPSSPSVGIFVATRLRCSACGEMARHYTADYNPEHILFTVPHAGLNGGIGEELEANAWIDEDNPPTKEIESLFLSECCDAPSATSLRRLGFRK